jgi:uncharacterized membrane protein
LISDKLWKKQHEEEQGQNDKAKPPSLAASFFSTRGSLKKRLLWITSSFIPHFSVLDATYNFLALQACNIHCAKLKKEIEVEAKDGQVKGIIIMMFNKTITYTE